MKKISVLLLGTVALAACAGMPPAWWTPRGTAAASSSAAPARPAAASTAAVVPEPAEQPILLQDETYEEMMLTPLQDEEGENASGDASAQSVPAEEPEADFLPPPSILED